MRQRLLRPRVVISVTLSLAIVAALLAMGNVRRIFAEATTFRLVDAGWFAVFFLLSESLKGAQWAILLRGLEVRLPRRSIALSFVVGEVTRYLPLGNYFPNYLLRETDHADFGLTSAATTTVVLLQVMVSLAGVAILGVDGWSAWLRPLVIVGSLIALVVFGLVYHFRARIVLPAWVRRHRQLRTGLTELRRFGIGIRRLAQHRRIVLFGVLICAADIASASAGLLVILQGLGVTTLSYGEVAGVFCFTLAFTLIEPSPVDLGVLELGGVGALLAVGVDLTTAVTAMLISRALSVLLSLGIAATGIGLLHRTFFSVLRDDGPAKMRDPMRDPSIP